LIPAGRSGLAGGPEYAYKSEGNDSNLRQPLGHGSSSHAETWPFVAAFPDYFCDPHGPQVGNQQKQQRGDNFRVLRIELMKDSIFEESANQDVQSSCHQPVR
jgi:hypothetical protein